MLIQDKLVNSMNEYSMTLWRTAEYVENNETVGAKLIDLSKVFNCIPRVLLLSKLVAYFEDKNLKLYIRIFWIVYGVYAYI